MKALTDAVLHTRLHDILNKDWYDLSECSYGGTGAPGKLLEELLGLDGGNSDTPDAGKWEIKYHSGRAPLTLFHLEAEPRNCMHTMVRAFGLTDKKKRTSFRHTIWGTSEKGFYVANESNHITVRHPDFSDIVWPYWTHDRLINAFVSKLRRLIVVKGKKEGNMVCYQTGHIYTEPKSTKFPQLVEQGHIAIDFDARTTDGDGRGLRNHGTKFRIKYNDLRRLYPKYERFPSNG